MLDSSIGGLQLKNKAVDRLTRLRRALVHQKWAVGRLTRLRRDIDYQEWHADQKGNG
jgi:hypothetical protein